MAPCEAAHVVAERKRHDAAEQATHLQALAKQQRGPGLPRLEVLSSAAVTLKCAMLPQTAASLLAAL